MQPALSSLPGMPLDMALDIAGDGTGTGSFFKSYDKYGIAVLLDEDGREYLHEDNISKNNNDSKLRLSYADFVHTTGSSVLTGRAWSFEHYFASHFHVKKYRARDLFKYFKLPKKNTSNFRELSMVYLTKLAMASAAKKPAPVSAIDMVHDDDNAVSSPSADFGPSPVRTTATTAGHTLVPPSAVKTGSATTLTQAAGVTQGAGLTEAEQMQLDIQRRELALKEAQHEESKKQTALLQTASDIAKTAVGATDKAVDATNTATKAAEKSADTAHLLAQESRQKDSK